MRATTSLCAVEADDRVAQGDDERVVADEGTGGEDRVPEAEGAALAGVEVLHRRALEGEIGEQLLLAALPERLHELFVDVEVVLDRGLALPGDEQDPAHAGAGELLEDVLDDGLAPHGQHFLRLRLGGGQETRPQPGDRNDGDINTHRARKMILPRARHVAASVRDARQLPWNPRCQTASR